MMTDREAAIENWEAQVRWEPEGNLPRIGLRGERYKVAGVLASVSRGFDPGSGHCSTVGAGESPSPWTLVCPSSGPGSRPPGTVWKTMRGAASSGARGLMEPGAIAVPKRRVLSRERIGANCDLVLGFERTKLQDRQPKDPNDTLRIALLDRKRFSGGVALTF